MAPKKTKSTLAYLIGKPIKVITKYSDIAEGPYILVGLDANYIGLERPNGKVFWWHNSYLMTLAEYEEETPIAE